VLKSKELSSRWNMLVQRLVEPRFCPQIWRLINIVEEEGIWNIIAKATAAERRAVLGVGALSNELVG